MSGNGNRKQLGGRVLIRMPVALHRSLVREAKAEGVSLNLLCVSKLAVMLGGKGKQ